MNSNIQMPSTIDDPRWLLSTHLDEIVQQRASHREVCAQHKRLQVFLTAEAEAQERVDTLKRRDSQELAEQLVSPAGLHVAVDHGDQSDAEWELIRARREADVARACGPAVAERITESSRNIAALELRTAPLVADVMIDLAGALAEDINAAAKQLRAKYARLWGLRRYVGDTEAIRRRLENVPLPVHPDHILPDGADLFAASEEWRAYAARLGADADAEFKE